MVSAVVDAEAAVDVVDAAAVAVVAPDPLPTELLEGDQAVPVC